MRKSPTDSFEALVSAKPKSNRNQLAWSGPTELTAWITAAPADGEANAALMELAAKTFGVPKRDIHILSGSSSRKKRIRVEGINLDEAHVRLSD